VSERRSAITGRIALVGGGGTGIGRATAEHLAASGHRVVLAGRRADVLDTAAKQIHDDTGAEVDAVVADVSAPDSAAVLYEVERRHGCVDVLVLNAGGPPPGRILQVTDEQ
jgi:3-oxoacyl-[acyl-carrier protein] reductase